MGLAAVDSCQVGSYMLCVSGQQPIPGWQVVSYIGEVLFRTTDKREAFTWIERLRAKVIPVAWGGPKNRCHDMRCRSWIWGEVKVDGVLGWEGCYCQRCMDGFVRACQRRHGRLPKLDTEFYCPRCGLLRAHPDDRCPKERDGRQRAICRPCRNAMQYARWRARQADKPAEIRIDEDEPARMRR